MGHRTVVKLVWRISECAARSYLGDRGCENHDFVKLSDALHESIDAWTLDNVDIMILSLDFHWNCEICLMQYLGQTSASRPYIIKWANAYLETTMNERLI